MSGLREGLVVWRIFVSPKHRGMFAPPLGVTKCHPLAKLTSTGDGLCQASLLVHVRNALDVPEPLSDIDAKLECSKRLLAAVDKFCFSRHWMMHVGPSKGEILTRSLIEAVNRKLDRKGVCVPTQFVVLELGAYCGYSAILMARALLETMKQRDTLKGHVFTTEINPESMKVANTLARMSGLGDMISINQIYFNGVETNVVQVARESMHRYETKEIDFLFIDHDKVRRHDQLYHFRFGSLPASNSLAHQDSYLPDLQKMERSGLLKKNTRVVADNVVFAQISDYTEYVQQRQRDGVVTTQTVVCSVEYSSTERNTDQEDHDSFRDGVGEFTFLPSG